MLAGSSTNVLPFFCPLGFAMPAGMILFSAGMSSSFSVYTRFFFLFMPFLLDSDFVFCSPPGLASDMDFCLRFEMPSGSLPAPLPPPLDFDFDDEDLDEDFDEDLPLGLLPFVEERVGAMFVRECVGVVVLQ